LIKGRKLNISVAAGKTKVVIYEVILISEVNVLNEGGLEFLYSKAAPRISSIYRFIGSKATETGVTTDHQRPSTKPSC